MAGRGVELPSKTPTGRDVKPDPRGGMECSYMSPTKRLRRWCAAAAVLVATHGGQAAIPCAWCATEFTQILNNVELLGVNATQAQALATQFRQLELQLRNARRIEPQNVLAVAAAWENLVRVLETTRGVSVHAGDVDERFRDEFGGYDRYATAGSAPRADRYRRWSDTNHEAVRSALKAAGLHAAQFYDEQATLRALERQAVGADGMLKVSQAGAQIAALQVEEGRKLRALLMAQVQMQGNIAATNTEREADKDAELERWKRREWQPENPGISTGDLIRRSRERGGRAD